MHITHKALVITYDQQSKYFYCIHINYLYSPIAIPTFLNSIIFDTRTKWTGIITKGVNGAPSSDFLPWQSTTATPVDSEKTDAPL